MITESPLKKSKVSNLNTPLFEALTPGHAQAATILL
jgi:hypothetical protein